MSGGVAVAAQGMPPGALCAKCRQLAPALGDTWCTGCTSWELLGRELSASWDSSGARLLAGDLVLNAARQVKALRSLSAGLTRRAEQGSAGASRAEPAEQGGREGAHLRESLPRRRSSEGYSERPKEEESDKGDESEEEESRGRRRSKTPDHRPIKEDHRRPPEPEGPPPGHRESGHGRESRREGRGHREERKEGHREGTRRKRASSHKPNRRGGRKHQRLSRLATNPLLEVHRKPGADWWELNSTRERTFELGNLCK